jgi:hypothetical protein
MQFRHAPVTQVLTASHRVGKVNAPTVSVVHISHRRGYPALCHYGVCFAEKSFRNDRDLTASGRNLDGCS